LVCVWGVCVCVCVCLVCVCVFGMCVCVCVFGMCVCVCLFGVCVCLVCVCVCVSVGGNHKSSENKGKSLKPLVVVLGLLLHVQSHTQSKQGTFTLSALPMSSIKLRTFKIHGWTFSQTVISKYPSRAMIQTDQLKGYLQKPQLEIGTVNISCCNCNCLHTSQSHFKVL